ncbi:MAG: molybdopterin molybdotransferase MoeA, partial [bacterium]
MNNTSEMISFENALKTIVSAAHSLNTDTVPLKDALGRVLSRDITGDADSPRFDNSAMDGYACRKCDLGKPMRVIETIQAGRVAARPVSSGECSRIMTGAMLPAGADTVVMFEHSVEKDGLVSVTRQSNSDNIRRKGEDGHAGDTVLQAGELITPGVIALLAAMGCDPVPVFIRPVVTVMATGDELVEPGTEPGAAKIRNRAMLPAGADTVVMFEHSV